MSIFGFFRFLNKRPRNNKNDSEHFTTKTSRFTLKKVSTMSDTAVVSFSGAGHSNISSSSSTAQHRYDGGRRYHNDENIAYILPNDEEEDDRIHLQHWAIKLVFGSNFDAPIQKALEEGINVLDSGCGPATWTLEMANVFPCSTFYGIDISSRFPNQIKPGNCEFLLHNIVDDFPFEENYFGFIHQRLVTLGIKQVDWPKVLRNLKLILKPGGWIELTEFSYLKMENPGPCHQLASDLSLKMLTSAGLDIDLGTNLPRLLSDAGFINIQPRVVDVPVNHGGKVGDLFWDDLKEGIQSLKPMFIKMHPKFEDPAVFEKFSFDLGEEKKIHKWTMPWTRVIAQKPLSSDI
ncbi:S-adenosyl-L-methionine-dependent methyltransferase [Dichotomocladium elegans]|nr:S-adenosyl-L-methionine-dependent methyltransferase [Dichotomocladium elegans]